MEWKQKLQEHAATLIAGVVLAAVVSCWAVVLLRKPAAIPDAPDAATTPATEPADAEAVATAVRLMSPGAVQTTVEVLGVIAGADAPLVLLSVNGGPADAYAPGERLGPSTVLVDVAADGVQLRQAGSVRTLPAPALPTLPDDGIVLEARAP